MSFDKGILSHSQSLNAPESSLVPLSGYTYSRSNPREDLHDHRMTGVYVESALFPLCLRTHDILLLTLADFFA